MKAKAREKKAYPTRAQARVLIAISKYVMDGEGGDFYPPLFPTFRELSQLTGKAQSSIYYVTETLVKKGYLATKERGGSKALGLTRKGMAYAKEVLDVARRDDESNFIPTVPGSNAGGDDAVRRPDGEHGRIPDSPDLDGDSVRPGDGVA